MKLLPLEAFTIRGKAEETVVKKAEQPCPIGELRDHCNIATSHLECRLCPYSGLDRLVLELLVQGTHKLGHFLLKQVQGTA